MRELRLTAKEHENFVRLMEKKLSEKEMSIEKLAQEIGVAKHSIYNYRTDTSRNPSKYLGGKIATYLNISIGEIRRG